MHNLRVWIGFAISAIFLYIAFRQQNFDRIWEALREANYWLILPGLILYFVGVYIRSYRWAVILRSIQTISTIRLFPIVVIGYMANNVLPLRAGEIVRSYVLSNRAPIKKTSILATIAVERIFDGLTMLGFILIASLSIGLTSQVEHVALLATGLFGVVLIGLLLITTDRVQQLLIHRIIPIIPDRIQARAIRTVESLFTGLTILRRRNDLVFVTLASLAAWLFEASMYWVISIGFDLNLSPAAILLVTAVANLATLIPSSPGYVGPFEAGVLLVLVGALGIERELAISYAVVVHAALYLPITIWGLIYWWRESLSWRDVQTYSEERAGLTS